MVRMQQSSKPTKSKKLKCHLCRTKITLAESLSTKCRCEHVFCSIHRHPEVHKCEALAQIKQDAVKNLAKTMVPVTGDKLNRI